MKHFTDSHKMSDLEVEYSYALDLRYVINLLRRI